MTAKYGRNVELKGKDHPYDSAKAAMRQATMESPITNKRPCRIYGERGERKKHKLKSLHLSRKDHVSISRQGSGHYADLKYLLHNIGRNENENV